MARYPGASWRPLSSNPSVEGRCYPTIVCLHTMVGSLTGTDAYFKQNGYGGTESHFGVGYDGTVYQWQDTLYQADANLDGNDRVISIETADKGTGFPAWTGSNVPAWTNAQVVAIAKILKWCSDVHDIPLVLIPNTAQSSRGVGYHRQGIDPWRCSTCERWSASYGKVCPGDRRVAQIPSVINLAKAGGEDDWMAFIENQADFNAAMSSWWNTVMNINGAQPAPNQETARGRAMPIQQMVGRMNTDGSFVNVHTIMGEMHSLANAFGINNVDGPKPLLDALLAANDDETVTQTIQDALAEGLNITLTIDTDPTT